MCRRIDLERLVFRRGAEDHRHIDGRLLSVLRCFVDDAVFVFEHDDGLELRRVARLHVLVVADLFHALRHIEIGVLEETELEDVPEQAFCRRLETRIHPSLAMLLDAHFIGFEHWHLVIVSAELVDAGHERLVMAVALREVRVLIAPGRRKALARRACDAPVRADDAVIVVLVAQQANLERAVGAADLVAERAVIAPCNGVRRHDRAGFLRLARQLQAALDEWRELRLEVAAGIDSVLAILRVRLAAALADAVTGPVLHHRVDAVLAPAFVLAVFLRGLLAVNRRLCHVARQCRVFAERAIVARPARVGCEVDLRRKSRAETNQTELFRRDFAEQTRQHHGCQSNITFLRHLEIPLPNHQKKNCAWKR